MKRALLVGLVLAPLFLVPTAHAEPRDNPTPAERAYLAEVEQRGVPVRPPKGALEAGHWACDDLRSGMPPQEVATKHFGAFASDFGPAVVDAAQHHLCPDALPAPAG